MRLYDIMSYESSRQGKSDGVDLGVSNSGVCNLGVSNLAVSNLGVSNQLLTFKIYSGTNN